MSADFKWGILSTARIARSSFIPGVEATPGQRVVAVASRSAGRAAEMAEAHGIPNACEGYEALLADPNIDAIYNPLPNDLHVPWTVLAAKAGKHVLCEKPIAMTAAEAEELRAAQRESGRLIVEAFMVHHHPQWKMARQLIGDGRIGAVGAIQTAFTYRQKDPGDIRNRPETGGGGLYDIGCYAITTARAVFGAEPTRVFAAMDTDPEMCVDRLTSAIVEFPGGRHLTFTCATQLAKRQFCQILGETAHMTLPLPFNPPRDHAASIIIDDGSDLTGARSDIITVPAVDQFALEVQSFAHRARLCDAGDGAADADGSLNDDIANMRVIDALFRSGASGQWEPVG
ncbi:Gfo/Idh/MocA family oxidoreductase [Fodinicurvata sp. EGI_FJ10296]|uniref:Gfo/Idh/MocA family protein n=1 Tax=Fodinicurvata sp. EGI_FJ10296 TaxID=3231908 RepID=UPI00345418B9